MPSCREILFASTLNGQQAVEKHQENLIYFALYGAYHSIVGMLNNGDYSDEQRLEISLMAEKLLLLIGGDNSGFSELFYNTLKILNVNIKTKNSEKTMEYLEKALRYAHDYEKRPDKTKYSVPWLCFCENNSENRMKHSQNSLFDELLDYISQQNLNEWFIGNTRFEQIISDCKACL